MTLLTLVLSVSWVSAAIGQTPVVHHDVDAAAALALAVERTGLPTTQLDPVPLATLFEAGPAVLGPGALRRCPRVPVQRDEVGADIDRATAARQAGDDSAAFGSFDRVVARLGCLSEVVDGVVAARAFLERGAHLAENGDLTAARGEFVTAASLDPAIAWDDTLAPGGHALFEELLKAGMGAKATVVFVPPKTPGGPWIDGREVEGELEVPPGLHLLQFTGPAGIESAWFSVGGDATLVLPRAMRPAMIDSVGSAAGSAAMGALLAAALPERNAAYVTDQGGLWLLLREGRDLVVTELEPRAIPEPPLTPKERRRREREERRARRASAKKQAD